MRKNKVGYSRNEMNNFYLSTIIVSSKIGIVDASLVRCLENLKNHTKHLSVHVTGSIYQNLIPIAHIYEFLAELSPVDSVITDNSQLERILRQTGAALRPLPEQELTRYTLERILKKIDIASHDHRQENKKLATVEELLKIYGANPKDRRQKIGLVSGSFDLIHLGHIKYIKSAKDAADVVVAAAMNTYSIAKLEKNSGGDRPIYNEVDRVNVLSASRSVDHVLVFNGLDCKQVIQGLIPDYFIKHKKDMSRQIIKEECALVERLGGRVVVTTNDVSYSSTDIIRHVRSIEGIERLNR